MKLMPLEVSWEKVECEGGGGGGMGGDGGVCVCKGGRGVCVREGGDRGDGGVCVCVRVGGDGGVYEDGRR